MHFFNVGIDSNFTEVFLPIGPPGSNSTLVQVMDWCLACGKPLPEPTMTLSTDTYVRQQA